MRNSAKWFLLLHLILGGYASSSVCSKLAAQQPFLSVGFILLYGGMLAALVPGDSFGCPGYFRMAYCIETEKVRRSFVAFEKFVSTEYGVTKQH